MSSTTCCAWTNAGASCCPRSRNAALARIEPRIESRRRSGRGGDAEPLIAEMREVSAELKRLEAELSEVQSKRDGLLSTLPNLPDPKAPDGADARRTR